MGVLEPVDEAFAEDVPATPPGFRDLENEDNSEDDLFAEPKEPAKPPTSIYSNELSFKNILPILPTKGDFNDILGERNIWELKIPTSKKEKYCSGCVEDMKSDLRKLAEVVDDYRKDKDVLRKENEALKKEVEELKKLLKQKEESEKGDVKVSIANGKEGSVDLLLRKNFKNSQSLLANSTSSVKGFPDYQTKYGIQSFSISLPKEATHPLPNPNFNDLRLGEETKSRKTVAELRKEFFAKEFQSEQETFTSKNYLGIKPEEKKETFRSRLTMRIKPKQKITEIISKLTSKIGNSKVIPEPSPVTMFQRFEKTRIVWENCLEKKTFT